MEDHSIKLTYVDKMILDSFSQLVDGLSRYLGDGYEIVLHSLEDYSHSVVKIVNGYHTGRTVGAPITDLALTMLEKICTDESESGNVAYFAKNAKGEPLWSSTISIKGEHERIIGLLCINLYLNTSFYDMIQNFSPKRQTDLDFSPSSQETFADRVEDLVEQNVAQVRDEVLRDPSVPANRKNREIIDRLNQRGIFKLKDAVQHTANILSISKNTVYMHIRNLNGEGE